jgi:phage shock protein A
MPHFSRLTDIITCCLTEIIDASENPEQTLREIIAEMNEGLAACRRNVKSSVTNAARLRKEINSYEEQIVEWKEQAKLALMDDDEDTARDALRRKVEVEDLIAGLRPELDAANSASQQMLRIQKALEARHAEATRKLAELIGVTNDLKDDASSAQQFAAIPDNHRTREVEAELEALKREIGG